MLNTVCPACQSPLNFRPDEAGCIGPCFRCGAQVRAPLLNVVCGSCATVSTFEGAMLGQQGPCRGCGSNLVVAHSPSGAIGAVQAVAQVEAPSLLEMMRNAGLDPVLRKEMKKISKEVSKVGGKITALRRRQVETAGGGSGFSIFGGSIRTDRVLQVMITGSPYPFVLTVPFAGTLVLPHEFASIVFGTLPSNLYLEGRFPAWLSGTLVVSGGDETRVIAALKDSRINLEGELEWKWEKGVGVVKVIRLQWGLQAVSVSPHATFLVMKTAKLGAFFKDFGVKWYATRQRAFTTLVYEAGGPPTRPEFYAKPLSVLALDWLQPGEA